MFDLNVDSASTNLPEEEATSKSQTTTHSGTSISSVVNADESQITVPDEHSNSNSHSHVSTLNFDILNNNSSVEIKAQWSTNFATRELFPVAGGEGSAAETTIGGGQWLNLGVSELGVQKQVLQEQKQTPVKKSRRGPRSRSSQYRGVTFYRRTGRWESHIWDCGKQVYLGGFDTAHAAARTYDLAAIKFRGVDADINFSISDYEDDMKQMKDLLKEEFVHILRRQSTGFSRGSSKYRGVTLHKCGRWEARMGQFPGKKAYDKAAIKCNGREAITNFESNTYRGEKIFYANRGGIDCDLDLNLCLSPPSSGPKGSDSFRNLPFNWSACELPDAKRHKIESSAAAFICTQTPHSLTTASKHSSIWPGIHSGFSPNYEERATGKRTEAIPLPGFSNWSWQMQSHGGITHVPLFSAAASSGFSSITPPAFKDSLLPSNAQSKNIHKLYSPFSNAL